MVRQVRRGVSTWWKATTPSNLDQTDRTFPDRVAVPKPSQGLNTDVEMAGQEQQQLEQSVKAGHGPPQHDPDTEPAAKKAAAPAGKRTVPTGMVLINIDQDGACLFHAIAAATSGQGEAGARPPGAC